MKNAMKMKIRNKLLMASAYLAGFTMILGMCACESEGAGGIFACVVTLASAVYLALFSFANEEKAIW